MITPADIEYKEFTKAVRGYKEEEVDAFLDLIIVDMENLIRENKKLKADLEKAKNQVNQHVTTETSVYETLEAAKSLMNDIAASAERRAEVLLKNAELEASLITKEARESIAKLTEEGSRLKRKSKLLRADTRDSWKMNWNGSLIPETISSQSLKTNLCLNLRYRATGERVQLRRRPVRKLQSRISRKR